MLGVVLALFHLSVTTADYSRYNIEWNGTSVLFDMIDEAGGAMVTDPSLLPGQATPCSSSLHRNRVSRPVCWKGSGTSSPGATALSSLQKARRTTSSSRE